MTTQQLDHTSALWVATTKNRKTGNVPTLYIGKTKEETKKSCNGCPMLDNGCYAHEGMVAMGHSSMIKANQRGKVYTLKNALLNSKRSAKMARFGAIGDPSALGIDYINKAVDAVKSIGLAPVGYTHFWKSNPKLAGVFMASVHTLEEADRAIAAGFRAAVVLPPDHVGKFTTPSGNKGIVCPAMVADVTCNDCRQCDGSNGSKIVIGFPNHSKKNRHLNFKKATTTAQAKSILDALDI